MMMMIVKEPSRIASRMDSCIKLSTVGKSYRVVSGKVVYKFVSRLQ